jgi:hypothetical protein
VTSRSWEQQPSRPQRRYSGDVEGSQYRRNVSEENLDIHNPTDGDIALSMVLCLMAELGKARVLPTKQLDVVLDVGLDLVGKMPENAKQRKRFESYRAAWTSS